MLHCLIPNRAFRLMFPECVLVNQVVHPNGYQQKSPLEVAAPATQVSPTKKHSATFHAQTRTQQSHLLNTDFFGGNWFLDFPTFPTLRIGYCRILQLNQSRTYHIPTLGKGRKLVIFKHTLNIGGPIGSPTNQRSRGIWLPDGAVEGPQKLDDVQRLRKVDLSVWLMYGVFVNICIC